MRDGSGAEEEVNRSDDEALKKRQEGKRKKNGPEPGPVRALERCVAAWLEATRGWALAMGSAPRSAGLRARGTTDETTERMREDERTRRKKVWTNDGQAEVGIIWRVNPKSDCRIRS